MNKMMRTTVSILCLLIGFGVFSFKLQASPVVDELTLSKEKTEVVIGKTVSVKSKGKAGIKVGFTDKKRNKNIEVISDKPEIAEVKKVSDTHFKLKGLKKGKTRVFVKSVEDNKLIKEFEIKVVTHKKKRAAKPKKAGKLVTLTINNFEKEVVQAKGRIAIMFGTSWCGYCRLLDPIYKSAAAKAPEIKFCVVDADKEEELSFAFRVTGYPTVYVLENNKSLKAGGYVRGWTADDYIKWIKE